MDIKSSLRTARETAGLTEDQISSLTKIPAHVLRDLESNSTETCGGFTYACGHIRSITKVLNQQTQNSITFDVDQIIAEMSQGSSSDNRKIIDRLASNNVATVPKKKKRISFKTLSLISAAVLSIGFVAQVAIDNVSKTTVDSVKVSAPIRSFQSESISNPVGVNLVISAMNGKSWVGLTDANGKRIFFGEILSGQVKTFSHPQLIKAVFGNAGAININLNGKDLGVVGAQGEVVRLDFDANGQD
jgi:cytoskeletal protein RodZ